MYNNNMHVFFKMLVAFITGECHKSLANINNLQLNGMSNMFVCQQLGEVDEFIFLQSQGEEWDAWYEHISIWLQLFLSGAPVSANVGEGFHPHWKVTDMHLPQSNLETQQRNELVREIMSAMKVGQTILGVAWSDPFGAYVDLGGITADTYHPYPDGWEGVVRILDVDMPNLAVTVGPLD